MNEWIQTAQRLAEEVDRAIEEHGSEVDIWWVQEKARSIAWHLRGAEAEIKRLREALAAAERALQQSPLVKPYKREQEALAIIRSGLA